MPRGIPNVMPKKTISSEELNIGQPKPLDIPMTGDVSAIARPDLEILTADAQSLGDYAAALAFFEEKLDVVVHESTDKNAEPIVDVYCNGTPQRFVRGQTQSVRRKYVEILARARQTSIDTKVSAQGADGEVVNRITKHSAVRYPFSVVYDPNPRGHQWLKQTLASA